MNTYHKIPTVYKRDPETKHRTLIDGCFATPELEYLQNLNWVFTEKVDGTNIRVMFDGEKITFGGKTENAQIPAPLLEMLAGHFLPKLYLFKLLFDKRVCLYGEGYGAKIQKGGKYRSDQSFVVFDVKVGDMWLRRGGVADIADRLGLELIPCIGFGTLPEMVSPAKKGFNSRWGTFLAEGIVARPRTELCARDGSRIITKIKHKDFRQ